VKPNPEEVAMKPIRVRDVMSTDIAVVGPDTPYREIVEVLAARRVSGVPVVDESDHVLGVVSEADLLYKVERAGQHGPPRIFERHGQRAARTKAAGDVAKELMTAPAVTVRAEDSVPYAAKVMEAKRVKRLPVVHEHGRLVGIVSRADLLMVHLRPDEDILREIAEEVLERALWIDPGLASVDVDEGVVTLAGRLDRRSTAVIAVRLAEAVPGVVDVVDELEYAQDDTDQAKVRFE
jgi:CBS-domain-containing membrane protein